MAQSRRWYCCSLESASKYYWSFSRSHGFPTDVRQYPFFGEGSRSTSKKFLFWRAAPTQPPFFCPPPFGGSHPPPKKKSFWHLFLLAAFSPFPHIFCCCRIFFKKRRKTKWFSHLFASSYQVPCIFCIILQKKGVLKKLYAKKRKENLKTNLLQKRFFPKDLYLATLRCYIKLTV